MTPACVVAMWNKLDARRTAAGSLVLCGQMPRPLST